MAEGDNKSANILAQETAQLEEQLQGWGEVILAGDRVLRWEKPWFPGALMGATTLVFMLVYYMDPSVLTGLSCTVMLLCLADYLVPTLAPRVFGSNKWTTEQQQRFHEICGNLVKTQRRVFGWWTRLFALKEEKPKMYFASVISSLVAVAWIGQQVHNLFLTYLIVCSGLACWRITKMLAAKLRTELPAVMAELSRSIATLNMELNGRVETLTLDLESIQEKQTAILDKLTTILNKQTAMEAQKAETLRGVLAEFHL